MVQITGRIQNKWKVDKEVSMKVSVILGHPYEGSFNAAIAKTVVEALRENGHQVMFHDLYQENFNPVIPLSLIHISEPTRRGLLSRMPSSA